MRKAVGRRRMVDVENGSKQNWRDGRKSCEC